MHFISLLKIDISLKSGTIVSNTFGAEIGIIISLNPVETIRTGKRSSKRKRMETSDKSFIRNNIEKGGLVLFHKDKPVIVYPHFQSSCGSFNNVFCFF